MKPEDQRIALAQWCGWRLRNASSMMPGTYYHIDKAVNAQPPDYLNDLNAMHEAEKHLKVDQIGDYENHLYGITDYRDWVSGEDAIFWRQHSFYRNIHATASQRAEALLRTVGLWKEDK